MPRTPLQKYKEIQKKKFQAYVERNITSPYLKWSWVSRVPLLDLNFIRKWRKKQWCWGLLTINKSISKEEKIKTKDEFPWDWNWSDEITSIEDYMRVGTDALRSFCLFNKTIVSDVQKYPDFPWNWIDISFNQNITEQFVLDNRDRFELNYGLEENFALSVDFFKRTEYLFCWNLQNISRNRSINEKNLFSLFRESDFKDPVIANNLSENEGISLDFILQNLHLPWNRELVSFRDDITKEHILNHPNFEWNWDIISKCKSLDKFFLQTHPKTNMDEFYLGHSGLIIDEVEHLPPECLSGNFLLGTDTDRENFLKKYYAVRVIGNAFFNCYWFPEYDYCKKRLNKQYDELFGINI